MEFTKMSETQNRFLLEAEVKSVTRLSRTTRWRMEKKGEFPQRRLISPGGRVGWLESEINEWLETRPQFNSQQPSHPAHHGGEL